MWTCCLIGFALFFMHADALYATNGSVVELTAENFEDQVLNFDGVVAVEFYAPWCTSCILFVSEFEKAAIELKGVVKFAAVDATQHRNLHVQFGIRGYPTIKVFGLDKKQPTDYKGNFIAPAIVKAFFGEAYGFLQTRLTNSKQEAEVVQKRESMFEKILDKLNKVLDKLDRNEATLYKLLHKKDTFWETSWDNIIGGYIGAIVSTNWTWLWSIYTAVRAIYNPLHM